MAVVSNPLLSGVARGNFADVSTFSRVRGNNVVRKIPRRARRRTADERRRLAESLFRTACRQIVFVRPCNFRNQELSIHDYIIDRENPSIRVDEWLFRYVVDHPTDLFNLIYDVWEDQPPATLHYHDVVASIPPLSFRGVRLSGQPNIRPGFKEFILRFMFTTLNIPIPPTIEPPETDFQVWKAIPNML